MDDRPGVNELRIEAGDKENAAGAVARISDRIIDCPVKVIVIGASRGRCAEPIVHGIANRTTRHAALVTSLRLDMTELGRPGTTITAIENERATL